MPLKYENREPAKAAEPAVAEDTEAAPPPAEPEPSPPAEAIPGFPPGNGPAAPQLHPELQD